MNDPRDKPARPERTALSALVAHKMSKKEKRAWITVVLAIAVLLLCCWARSSL